MPHTNSKKVKMQTQYSALGLPPHSAKANQKKTNKQTSPSSTRTQAQVTLYMKLTQTNGQTLWGHKPEKEFNPEAQEKKISQTQVKIVNNERRDILQKWRKNLETHKSKYMKRI